MSLDNDVLLLSKIPLLGNMDWEALRLLAFSMNHQNIEEGEVLIHRGEKSDAAYLVVAGSVVLDNGKDEPAQLTIVHPGSLIGEMTMITETKFPYDAIAREPTEIGEIPRNMFHRVMREHPGSAARMRTAIEQRLSAFAQELRSFEA